MDNAVYEPKTFTQVGINLLHEAAATILWFERGKTTTYDYDRINRDWLDARRIVGFKLADAILTGCQNGICYSIPTDYFSYLSSISILEFKKLKAYFLWLHCHDGVPKSDEESESIYLDACEEVEQGRINCKCLESNEIPENIKSFLLLSKQNYYFEIIKRKAHWNSIFEKNYDEEYNWAKAEKLVGAIYDPIESFDSLSKDDVLNIVKLIDENHHLTNMFEYSLRCHLFRQKGLTRPPLSNLRSLAFCIKTMEPISS